MFCPVRPGKYPDQTAACAETSSLMKSIIVRSVSAWGAVLIFLLSRSTSLFPVICSSWCLSFPRGSEIRVRRDLLLAMLRAPADALAQLLCEKSRLLKAAKWAALL
jgi:hypothetical protein